MMVVNENDVNLFSLTNTYYFSVVGKMTYF